MTATPDPEQIIPLQRIVRRVPVAEHVARYALALARLSRPVAGTLRVPSAGSEPHRVPSAGSGTVRGTSAGDVPEFIRQYVSWGAGPRASQYLVLGAKARAVLYGRHYANTEDIRAVAYPVLRHRIMTNFNAEAEGVKPDEIVRRLIEFVAAEDDREDARGKLPQVFRSGDPGQS